jgi:L-ornithine Nalpha-acyltransferase
MYITDNKPDLSSCKMGNIYLKLAETQEEVTQAQKLRHFVFFEEPAGKTVPSGELDKDEFDDVCEHLLVMDGSDPQNHKVVGNYRLLRKTKDKKVNKFYTEGEFDISGLKNSQHNIVELGRSCTYPGFRDGRVIQLLWSGIGAFIAHHKIKYLFGCASFFGTDVKEHELPISYLINNHLAPAELRSSPKPEVAAKFDVIPADQINKKEAFSKLPPLLKGYIRTGCMVGNGAVIDELCKTTDVFIIMDTEKMVKRYSEHFVDKK